MTAEAAIEAMKKPLSDREAIYIVTGLPRSGTSMMMRALDEGGIPAEWNKDDQSHLELEKQTGYLANPHGYYEVGRGQEPWFFPSNLPGRCVKLPWSSMPAMAPGQRYRVIMLLRDPEAIKRSLSAYMSALGASGRPIKPQLLEAHAVIASGRYWEMSMVTRAHLENRRDVEHLVIARYEEVLAKPRGFFEALAGWPLDVEKASAVPEERWNRAGTPPNGGSETEN